ncbi:MAG: hypothetical protein H6711_30155 [Myxococcales bacterium]|nr:hypothetical protein [Myxococcales bacterium]
MPDRVLGIGGLDHNASIALVEGRRLVGVLEVERPTRRKNTGLVSSEDLELTLARLGVSQVEHLALTDHTFLPQRPWLGPWLDRRFPGASRSLHEHHACRLAAAYYTSGWSRSAVLSLDGKGDGLSAAAAIGDREEGMEILLRVPSAHSVGRLWWAASVCCRLGDHHAAGKTMAWAAHGTPSLLPALRASLKLQDNGGFQLRDQGHPERFRNVAALAAWLAHLDDTPQPERGPRHRDVAASVQALTEEIVVHMARRLVQRTGARALAYAGGVALNGLANHRLLAEGIIDDLHVPPLPDDRGLALGAVALATAARGGALHLDPGGLSPFLGPEPSRHLPALPAGYVTARSEELLEDVAACLARGELVAWFEGRDEAGPRALGHRSILASPVHVSTREHLNAVVKEREPFRPFGCSLPLDATSEWLDMRGPSPFMLRIVSVLPHRRAEIPAVVHTDGTTRPHTVTDESHPRLHALLGHLARRGHPPVLLNTSLNRRGEPIAHTAADAVAIAVERGLDAVVIGDHLVVRSSSGSRPTSSGR